MWARWCLGSIGGLAEVARRGDSVGKRDMNDLCGFRGLVGRGGVWLRRWGMVNEAMWFVDEFGRMFAIEHYCATRGLTGDARLVERLKPGNTADIMKRIEDRLETFRKSDFAGCGQMLKKALKYAIGEWPAMKRVLECGEVELSNNLSEQMMRRIKMNLKNACNIGSEISAKHNAFMFSVIESCKMIKRNVEDYLKALFRRLRTAKEGEDLTCCLPCYMSF